MKRVIRLRESELKRLISESVKRVLKETEEISDYDDELDDYDEEDDELSYDMRELQKAFQKQDGTYHATSQDGSLQTGDRVIVHSKNMGDIEGVIDDFGTHLMTWEETADVKYFKDGKEWTLVSVPLDKIEKIG